MHTQPPALTAAWMGRVDYEAAWELQRNLFDARLKGACGDLVLLLEHPPTYTLGRRAEKSDVVYDEAQRTERGISLYEVDRGGRATYHGPGQLVGYPIVALGERFDVLAYLRSIEETLVRTAAEFGVAAERDRRHTGIWVGRDKLGAIGVKITRGITMHGFALNVTTDLSMFEGIVPCGIPDRWVTSLEAQTGTARAVEEVASTAATHLASVLNRSLVWTHPAALNDVRVGGEESEDRSERELLHH
ncbi:MAG TPA: lipoyl(octanoyl) transferase LipB [Actinomycetota bacterium]|nr:lipoyl(octanoyl) transferase LipB [Actinomycetota bacterium]